MVDTPVSWRSKVIRREYSSKIDSDGSIVNVVHGYISRNCIYLADYVAVQGRTLHRRNKDNRSCLIWLRVFCEKIELFSSDLIVSVQVILLAQKLANL